VRGTRGNGWTSPPSFSRRCRLEKMRCEPRLSRTNFIGEILVATVCGAFRTSFSTAFSPNTSSSLPASMSGARLIGSERGVDG